VAVAFGKILMLLISRLTTSCSPSGVIQLPLTVNAVGGFSLGG
jgi:hypothetical protein